MQLTQIRSQVFLVILYTPFFSHDQIGWILVRNFSKIFGNNRRIMLSLRIVSDISLVLFFKISDGDMQVEHLLSLSLDE